MSTSRWVVVDDTDSAITYSGPWIADKGTLDTNGNFGAPYLSTSHGTNSTASFTYKFSGTRVLITGSLQFSNPTGATTWQCFVDNQSFPSNAYTVPENNLNLCEQDTLTDGPHTLMVNVAVTNGQTFWLDYIKFLPSANASLDTAAIAVDSTDPALLFDSGWSQFAPGFQTGKAGSKLSFSFTGISVIYYGFYDPSLPFDTTTHTAAYSIDGQTPVPFTVQVDAGSQTSKPSGVQYNQVLFTTGNLTAGPHILEVTYLGTPQTTPLTYEFLVIQNGTSSVVSSTTPAVTSGASTTPLPSDPSTFTLPGGTSTFFTTVDPSSTESSPTTTTTSAALSVYQSNMVSMFTLIIFVLYFLSGRNLRSH
ncbi:hypothetical protein BDN70DRAFT_878961 [Pholiota conissans]|uniref:Uncharacterized protein n=1 Tax=Pholiota conissans TaxID=109636 RepID=A0A9P5Z3N3_9AGAR|nr:hypothetical protein BDN70DRAFT_878961 [Pholiota conissans]